MTLDFWEGTDITFNGYPTWLDLRFRSTFFVSALLLASAASLSHAQKPKDAGSTFPSREAICAPVYGVFETGSVPYCPARFGQCLKAEGDSISRLSSSWHAIPKKIRDKCQSDSLSRRASLFQTYPKALALAQSQGHHHHGLGWGSD